MVPVWLHINQVPASSTAYDADNNNNLRQAESRVRYKTNDEQVQDTKPPSCYTKDVRHPISLSVCALNAAGTGLGG